MKYLLPLILFLAPVLALAGPVGARQIVVLPVLASDGTSFATEDMTGPAQTSVLDVRGLDYIQIFMSALSVSGTANVTTDCYLGPSDTDANYHVQSESISAGVATQTDYIPTHSVTTSDKWPTVIPTQRASYLYCTFTCASGTMDVTIVGGNF